MTVEEVIAILIGPEMTRNPNWRNDQIKILTEVKAEWELAQKEACLADFEESSHEKNRGDAIMNATVKDK